MATRDRKHCGLFFATAEALEADGIAELIGSNHVHGNVDRAIEAQLTENAMGAAVPGGVATSAAS